MRVYPGASRNELAGERDGAVVVRLTAPPLEGRANEALRKLIAKQVGVAKGRVRIVRGERRRDKVVSVDGRSEAELQRLLGVGEAR